jgi:hypothetical protein
VRWFAFWGVLAALLATAGWFVMRRAIAQRRGARLASLPLQTRKLPGFDIDLPSGRAIDHGPRYRDGRLVVNDVGGIECSLQVEWEPGGLLDDDEVKIMNKAVAGVLQVEARPLPLTGPIVIGGPEATTSWAARMGRATNWATQVACGARRVVFMTISKDPGAEALQRRVAKSFRCHPDTTQEAMLDDVPVMFDLEPGWFRKEKSDDQLELTNRRAFVTARSFPRAAAAADPDVIEMLGKTGAYELHERVGTDRAILVKTGGESVRGWATQRVCADIDQVLFLTSFAASDEEARRLLSRARCRKRGEAAQTWAELPTAAK